ncbi:MAG: InlB B-repeat-containing protein [Oscillospiraceae bacterium]|nr:InlB B-repeat-containing protein [Oscillospiraceae bacterium]
MDRFVDWYEDENSTTTKKTEHQDDTQLIEAFGDADDIASYAADSVENCRVYGLVEGFEDGNFYPLLASTRAEIAAVIYRLTWKETTTSSGGSGGGGGGSSSSTYYDVTYYASEADYTADTPVVYTTTDEEGSTTTHQYRVKRNATHTIIADPANYTDEATGIEYVFTGWQLQSDTTTTYKYGDSIKVTADVDLVAQWEEVGEETDTYTVTYYDYDGTTVVGEAVTVESGATYIIEDRTASLSDGYTFTSWLGSNGTTYQIGDKYQVTGDLSLYAQGTPIETSDTYTVTYYDYTGAEIGTYDVAVEDTHTVLGADAFELDAEVIFDGWNTQLNGQGEDYAEGDTITAATSLYAQGHCANDWIGIAVSATIDDFNEQVSSWSKSDTSITIENVKYNGSPIKAEDGSTRTQYVNATVVLGDESVNEVIAYATSLAMNVLGISSEDVSVSEISSVIKEIAVALTGDDTLDDVALKELAVAVRDSLRATGAGWWNTNFYDADGVCYSGNATIEAEGGATAFSAVYNVGTKTLTGYDSLTEAAVVFGTALAKDFYQELHNYTDEYVSTVDLQAYIYITFSGNETYENNTDNFPYEYPVELNLTLTDESGTVEYWYDGTTDNLKLNLTQYSTEYKELVDSIAARVFESKAVANELGGIDVSALTSNTLLNLPETDEQIHAWIKDNSAALLNYYYNNRQFTGVESKLTEDISDSTRDLIIQTLDTAADSDNPATYFVMMNTLIDIRNVLDDGADSTLSAADIAALLDNELVQNNVGNINISGINTALNYLETAIGYVPAGATITITDDDGNSYTVEGSDVKALNTTDLASLYSSLIDILDGFDNLDDLTAGDFFDGVTITATTTSGLTHTIILTIA